MRLDNRSRAILVVGDGLEGGQTRESVKDWYEGQGGSVEMIEEGWRVGFPTREMAEKVRSSECCMVHGAWCMVQGAWCMVQG